MKHVPIYGLLAEFDSPRELLEAARRTYREGYRKLDAFSPFPIEELAEAIGFHKSGVPLVTLIGGLLGCLGGFLMQWWIATINYPINVGGRPLNSWPAFVVVTFETTILFAGLAAVLGMLALNGLPMPYHPVFNVARFRLATKDRFFLIVFSSDAKYEPGRTRRFLESLAPRSISEVPS